MRILERSALAAVTAFVVVAGGSLLFSSGILDDASPFLWPVLALGAFLFASTCAKTFQLWIKRDHTRLWGGMTTILVLVWTLPMAGVGGAFADTFRLATTLERDPSAAEALVFQWLIRDTTLLATALLLCLAGALAWFLLRQWIVLVEQAHREVLGIDDKQPTGRS